MNGPILSVKNLSVSIRRSDRAQGVNVVDRVSFDLQPGEILALVGESGCGKTKTAEAIMRLLPRHRWSVRAETVSLGDSDLSKVPEAAMRKIRGRDISMIFQEPLTALDPVFTVGNQLGAVFRRHLSGNRREVARSSIELLERVGFAEPQHVLQCYPHQLSGGMRQRVMTAMAMACRPRVLIADEPTTALDVTTQAQVLDQLTRLAGDYETSILLITHDLGVVAQYCDRALVMLQGKLIETATVQDLFTRPEHAYTQALLNAVSGARPA